MLFPMYSSLTFCGGGVVGNNGRMAWRLIICFSGRSNSDWRTLLRSGTQKSTCVFRRHKDYVQDQYIMEELPARSLTECQVYCPPKPRCVAISFLTTRMCRLHSQIDLTTGNLTVSSGAWYSYMSTNQGQVF